jgi:ADP-heptose:LPS heptosyltransferase
LRQLVNLIQEIRRQHFDLLLDLSLGWHVGFAGIVAGIEKRVGFDFRGRGRFLTKRIPIPGFHDQPVAGYYLDLLPLCGLKRPPVRAARLTLPARVLSLAREHLSRLHLQMGAPLVGLVPGGGASWRPNAVFKQWAPDHFAQLADEIAQRRNSQILLIGDARESSLCEEVRRRMKDTTAVLLGAPSVLVLAGALKECALVVGNDSGPMHLAAALGTRTVSIFGPVDPEVYGPLGQPDELFHHRIVVKDLPCRPCYKGFRFPPCPWDNACLKKLEVPAVLEAVDAALA